MAFMDKIPLSRMRIDKLNFIIKIYVHSHKLCVGIIVKQFIKLSLTLMFVATKIILVIN